MHTILRVPVDPETLLKLQNLGDAVRRTPEEIAGQRLSAAVTLLPPSGRAVVVSGEVLETLESILGGGSILNPEDLQKKVSRLAGISFLHVRLPFTPNQLEMLTEKAERNSLTVEELVNRTAPRIYEQFFDLVARV